MAAKKYTQDNTDNPLALCDDAMHTVYKTFYNQDDQMVTHKQIKEANQRSIMEHFVEIQRTEMKLVKQLEMHPNCQLMAKLFYQMA
jgi:hypothetical protein